MLDITAGNWLAGRVNVARRAACFLLAALFVAAHLVPSPIQADEVATRASEPEPQSEAADDAGTAGPTDPGTTAGNDQNPEKVDHSDWFLLPAIFYSTETSFLLVVGFLATFGETSPGVDERLSNIQVAATYTLNNQFVGEVHPEFFFFDGKYHLKGKNWFWYFPDRYYGLGNESDANFESYVSLQFRSLWNFEREIAAHLFIGASYEFTLSQVLDAQAGGALVGEPGGKGARTSGIGAQLVYDDRDSSLSPHRGGIFTLSTMLYDGALGSQYSFSMTELDLREYLPIVGEHVLALRFLGKVATKSPPIQKMAAIGGKYTLRGFFEGRYRDRNLLSAQLEYRAPLWWRFGGVLFAGVGEVAQTIDAFDLEGVHPCAGFGVRFLIDPATGVNLRFDLGFSADFVSAHFTILEAF